MKKIFSKIVLLVIVIILSQQAKSQVINLVNEVILSVIPTQEITMNNSDTASKGILASMPSGTIIKIQARVSLADTSTLSMLYIKLGTSDGSNNLIDKTIDFKNMLINGDSSVSLYDTNMTIDLGEYTKPEYLWVEVKSRNNAGFESDPVTSSTY
jgi:hypothetical protein